MGSEEAMVILARRYRHSLEKSVARMMQVFENEMGDVDRAGLPPPNDHSMRGLRMQQQRQGRSEKKQHLEDEMSSEVSDDTSSRQQLSQSEAAMIKKIEKLIISILRMRMAEDSHGEVEGHI